MRGSPLYILVARIVRARLSPPVVSSARRVAKVSLHGTAVAALLAMRHARQVMFALGGFAEDEAFDRLFASSTFPRPVWVPPSIEREDNRT